MRNVRVHTAVVVRRINARDFVSCLQRTPYILPGTCFMIPYFLGAVFGTFFFFSIPFVIFALLFSLHPSRNSDPGSNSKLFSPPTHYGSCLAFLSREDFSSFFPRRLASDCAYPRYALSVVDPFLLSQIKSESRHGGIRTHGSTLVAFEGYH